MTTPRAPVAACLPGPADVYTAAARIAAHARVTPVLRSGNLDRMSGARMHFKCEHLQHGGAFKFRGASNAVWALTDAEADAGVVTHSSGNHGRALALAAAARGIPAHVVVPEGAVRAKVEAIAAAGARVYRCAPTQAAREAETERVQAQTGARLVHPYADPRVIAGQGTVALELLQQVPGLDVLLTPVGGGGLAAGCAIVARALRPKLQLVGAEPAGADDAARSLREGRRIAEQTPDTICDGLRATIGAPNFDILRACDVQVLTVTDAQVVQAMRLLWSELRQVVEPSSATVLAVMLACPEVFAGKQVGVVLTGGNVDLEALPPGLLAGDVS